MPKTEKTMTPERAAEILLRIEQFTPRPVWGFDPGDVHAALRMGAKALKEKR